MPRNKFRQMANRINTLPYGMALTIDAQELNDLPSLPLWALESDITLGFDRVKQYILGSDHSDLWSFTRHRDGSVTAYKNLLTSRQFPLKCGV